jgi:hypothetical protein
MFDIESRSDLPVQFIEIQSIAVRGDLGMISVYACENDDLRQLSRIPPSRWKRLFGPKELEPSRHTFEELVLDVPIRMAPNRVMGVYVHSQLPGDLAIVYDNHYGDHLTYEDSFIKVHPGISHTSNVP